MQRDEIVKCICACQPASTLSDDDIETLKVGVRIAFDFREFIVELSLANDVNPDIDRVRWQIAASLGQLYDVRRIAGNSTSELKLSQYEKTEYVNETTVAGAEFFVGIEQLVPQIASAMRSIPLRWQVYPSVIELRAEYLIHFEALQAFATTPEDRLNALLNAIRLQLIFLANTF